MKPSLEDFLKCRKVKCVESRGRSLTVGKIYTILSVVVPLRKIKVENDTGANVEYDIHCFEPVLESAENPPQNIELTPEFEAVEPRFKVGDKVYVGLTGKIVRVTKIIDDDVVSVANKNNEVRAGVFSICHATPENYERLQATFPDIEFEAPAKPLKGSDLCRAMLAKGWKYVPCYVHDGSDDEAINRKHYVSVTNETPRSGYNFSGTGANDWKYAVPIDPKTGEIYDESILNGSEL